MLAAKSAAPIGSSWPQNRSIYDHLIDQPVTLIQAPPGYFLADELAQTLRSQGVPHVWLRFDPNDRDPATILLNLIQGAQRLKPGLGAATRQLMIAQPGPVYGWAGLCQSLAKELASELPENSVFILEHVHHLSKIDPGLGSMGRFLFKEIPPGCLHWILISQRTLPWAALPAKAGQVGTRDLRLDARSADALAESLQAGLPSSTIHRLNALADGQEVSLLGVLTASLSLGPAFVQQAIQASADSGQILSRLASACLALSRPEATRALSLALRLGYSHPDLLDSVLQVDDLARGPWVQPLEDGWQRLRIAWQAPLRTKLADRFTSVPQTLRQAAAYLASHSAEAQAIDVLLEARDHTGAARLITQVADEMLNHGQWDTLERWLNQLPASDTHDLPALIYLRGELQAGRGELSQARRTFQVSARRFAQRAEIQSACQSLLAASALSFKQGNFEAARAEALKADALAQSAQLPEQLAWASWQLGRLAAQEGDAEAALGFFNRAFHSDQDSRKEADIQPVRGLAEELQELNLQKSRHYQALEAIEQSEAELSARLYRWIEAPVDDLPGLIGRQGWAETPFTLKLKVMPTRNGHSNQVSVRKTLQNLSSRLKWRVHAWRSIPSIVDQGLPPIKATQPPLEAVSEEKSAAGTVTQPADLEAVLLKSDGESAGENHELPSDRLSIAVHMLGAFQLAIDGKPVKEWASTRGLAVFKFLLAGNGRVVPREVLMETFWPGADPEAARNNLNVAIYGLRQSLRVATEKPVIAYMLGNYGLEPEIELWMDLEEFERHFQEGSRQEAVGQLDTAAQEYELAVSLYQGDFLEGDPYEEWTILPRERMRYTILEVLERLSQIYFARGQYAACVNLCQRILERDNCREDAHRRLMACYQRLGQRHLALRQYQVCIEALRSELDIDPEPATVQLAEDIRRDDQRDDQRYKTNYPGKLIDKPTRINRKSSGD